MRYQATESPPAAGQPIIEVMKRKGLVNACVVVRYYKRLAGPALPARRRGASLAVATSGVVSMEPSAFLQVEVPYALWDRLQRRLQTLPVLQEGAEFGASAIARLRVRLKDLDTLKEALLDLSDGRAFMRKRGGIISPGLNPRKTPARSVRWPPPRRPQRWRA